jgi:hypothetical protein
VVLAAPIAWIGSEGLRDGFLPWEKSILVLACLFPPLAVLSATQLSLPMTPIVLGILFLMIVTRVLKAEPAACAVSIDGKAQPAACG